MCTVFLMRYALSKFAEWMDYLNAQKIVNNINSMFSFFFSRFFSASSDRALVSERRNGAIASDRTAMRIGCFRGTQRAGSVACMLTGPNWPDVWTPSWTKTKAKRPNGATSTSHCCENRSHGICPSFAMFNAGQPGRILAIGAWGVRRHRMSCRHATMVSWLFFIWFLRLNIYYQSPTPLVFGECPTILKGSGNES